MYRHGFNGTLYRGKRKTCASPWQQLRSRVRVVLKATYGRVAGMREANKLSFKPLTSSGFRSYTDRFGKPGSD